MLQMNLDNPKRFISQAIELANQAVEAEKSSNFAQAYQLYSESINKCKMVGIHRTREDIKPLYESLYPKITSRAQELEDAGWNFSPPSSYAPPVEQQMGKMKPGCGRQAPPKSQPNNQQPLYPTINQPQTSSQPHHQKPQPHQQQQQQPASMRPQQQKQPQQQPVSQRPKINRKSIPKNPNKNDQQSNDQVSVQNAIMYERPDVRFDDVAGLEGAKQALNEAVIMPIRVPHLFDAATQPWRGILLYGPPGTGKSFLAKAVAGEADDSTFLTVSTSDLTSKWVGESEKLIKSLFETARAQSPSVIFLDEIDSLVSERGENDSESGRRIKTEFLVQMDGVGVNNTGVLVVAATNLPWALDQAMRRRFEKRIYVPLPDRAARKTLLKSKMKGSLSKISEKALDRIVNSTEGYSGADLGILVRDALMQPIREVQSAKYFKRGRAFDKDGVERDGFWVPCKADDPDAVKAKWSELNPDEIGKLPANGKHFAASFNKLRPSVSKKDIQKYEQWTREYGEEGA